MSRKLAIFIGTLCAFGAMGALPSRVSAGWTHTWANYLQGDWSTETPMDGTHSYVVFINKDVAEQDLMEGECKLEIEAMIFGKPFQPDSLSRYVQLWSVEEYSFDGFGNPCGETTIIRSGSASARAKGVKKNGAPGGALPPANDLGDATSLMIAYSSGNYQRNALAQADSRTYTGTETYFPTVVKEDPPLDHPEQGTHAEEKLYCYLLTVHGACSIRTQLDGQGNAEGNATAMFRIKAVPPPI